MPVIHEDLSESKNSMAFATSLGIPIPREIYKTIVGFTIGFYAFCQGLNQCILIGYINRKYAMIFPFAEGNHFI